MIDLELHGIVEAELAFLDDAVMDEEIAQLLLRIGNPEQSALRPADDTSVTDLAARFAIERRLVQHQRRLVARLEALDETTIRNDTAHDAFRRLGLVAEELGGADLLAQFEPDSLRRRLARPLPGFPRLGFLMLHRLVEGVGVDGHAARFQRVLRQIERKPVGVVKLEGDLARQHVTAIETGARLVEQSDALLQRAAEAGFLELQRLGNQRLRADQLLIAIAHLPHERRHQPVHQRLDGAEQMRMTHGAPHDPAQHVAASLVRGQHTISDEEARRAQMIGNDAMACLEFTLGLNAGCIDRGRDQRLEKIRLVVVVRTLQHGGDTLEAHAGVDRWMRQVDPVAGSALVILHEHEIPDLDEAIAVRVVRAGRSARDLWAVIEEDFRTGAARTRIPHCPEIIRGRDADDLAVGKAADLLPDPVGLVVLVIDGHQQPCRVEPVFLRHQPPRELDRDILEVIAEREVAQHLEEGVVAGRIADVIEVVVLAAGAHTLLRGRRTAVGAHFLARKHVLELHHAGVGEHQGRVVARHQR